MPFTGTPYATRRENRAVAARVEVETTRFEFAHGRKPRGTGCWAFDMADSSGREQTVFAPGTMSYAAAKDWAQREAVARKARRVYVAS